MATNTKQLAFDKISTFLEQRNINFLLNSFVTAKIDDNVASQVEDSKLSEIGLTYGDILLYRQIFPLDANSNSVTPYKERMRELKEKITRTHSGRYDKMNRPISINETYRVTIGLKCLEQGKYRLKMKNNVYKTFSRTATYEEVLLCAKEHFVTKALQVYLGTYDGKKLEKNFTDVESFASIQKTKKRPLRVYLFYPKPYSYLQWKKLCSDVVGSNSDEDFQEDSTEQDNVNSLLTPLDLPQNDLLSFQDNSTLNSDLQDVQQDIQPLLAPLDLPQEDLLPLQANSTLRSTLQDVQQDIQPIMEKAVVCTRCGCTKSLYTECLRCIQNDEYMASLLCDQQKDNDFDVEPPKDTESDGETSTPPLSPIALREARINRFSNKPIRFRHSIGSPSLTMVQSEDIENNQIEFGDEEVSRFMENVNDEVQCNDYNATEVDMISFLNNARFRFTLQQTGYNRKHVIIQRSKDRFWKILLKQNFNVANEELAVRFAGEAGADAGGPLREFLTLAMKHFIEIPGMLMGQNFNLSFKMLPENLKNNDYYKLGQLTGLSIIKIGRGPECFNPTLVRCLLHMPFYDQKFEIEDAELAHKLSEIEAGNTDDLLLMDIPIHGESKELFKTSFVFLKNFSAIEQFSRGLNSIDKSFTAPENFEVMKSFLTQNAHAFSLQDFLDVIVVKNEAEENSNKWNTIQDNICDMELFFASVANGEMSEYGLADLLYLFTGLERIPPFGLHKKIEIEFSEDETLPSISTCGYNVTLPMNCKVQKNLEIALKFGGGLGSI